MVVLNVPHSNPLSPVPSSLPPPPAFLVFLLFFPCSSLLNGVAKLISTRIPSSRPFTSPLHLYTDFSPLLQLPLHSIPLPSTSPNTPPPYHFIPTLSLAHPLSYFSSPSHLFPFPPSFSLLIHIPYPNPNPKPSLLLRTLYLPLTLNPPSLLLDSEGTDKRITMNRSYRVACPSLNR